MEDVFRFLDSLTDMPFIVVLIFVLLIIKWLLIIWMIILDRKKIIRFSINNDLSSFFLTV